jgi:hypothetical protein
VLFHRDVKPLGSMADFPHQEVESAENVENEPD